MTKQKTKIAHEQLLKMVVDQTGIKDSDVRKVIDTYLKNISSELQKGGKVSIKKIGIIYVDIANPKKRHDFVENTIVIDPKRALPKIEFSRVLKKKIRSLIEIK